MHLGLTKHLRPATSILLPAPPTQQPNAVAPCCLCMPHPGGLSPVFKNKAAQASILFLGSSLCLGVLRIRQNLGHQGGVEGQTCMGKGLANKGRRSTVSVAMALTWALVGEGGRPPEWCGHVVRRPVRCASGQEVRGAVDGRGSCLDTRGPCACQGRVQRHRH